MDSSPVALSLSLSVSDAAPALQDVAFPDILPSFCLGMLNLLP